MSVSEPLDLEAHGPEVRIHAVMHRLTGAEKRVARALLGSYLPAADRQGPDFIDHILAVSREPLKPFRKH